MQKSTSVDTTEWERWSTGNCARNLNFSIRKNDICTTQNPPGKWDTQTSLGICETNWSRNLGLMTWRYDSQQKKKKRSYRKLNFALLTDHSIKLKESEKKDKYPDLARQLKILEHKRDSHTNCYWWSWYSHQKIDKGSGGIGNKKTNGNHPNYNIDKIAENTKRSSVNLRRVAIT